MERFLLEQAQHIPLLLPFMEWLNVGYLSSASRRLTMSVLRDVFFRHALVVVPGCTLTNDAIRGILTRLSPLARHVAISNPAHLPLLRRLPHLSMLRVAKPPVFLLDEHADDTTQIQLGSDDIQTLCHLSGVVQLDLEANVDDFGQLVRGMGRLHTLNLVFRSRVGSFDPLTDLHNLRALSIQCEAIDNIRAIGSLAHLVSLSLSSWGVHDTTALGQLPHLEQLDLSRCNVLDVAPLGRLRMLRYLTLDDTPVHDLWPLAGLMRLQFLSLARSQASDLTPLSAHAASLHYLDLSGCTLSRVSTVHQLQQLECLRMQGTTWSTIGTEPSLSATLAALHYLRVVDGRVNSLLSRYPVGDHTRLELGALQNLHYLESLELTGASVTHRMPPLALPYLVWLRIEWSYTRELDVPLAAVVHPRLRVLHLVRARLRRVHNLEYAPQLQELRLVDVLLEDLSAIPVVANLRRFEHSCAMVRSHDMTDDEGRFSRAPTTDLTALGMLLKLQYLDLSSTSLSDLEPLQFLVQLRYVDLSDTDVRDVVALRPLELLECIRLRDTEISHFEGGAYCRVLVELTLPAHVDCRPIRRAAPQLKKLLHPDRDCLWSGHAPHV